ncbi:unnamed protein product [Sphenostylis stenocarpa]|uniref:Uncharacterized protein n=1 Tax=Sphenostylis stenocarpa TaxID=92480 RepID=A0AA86VL59_9FABA|nr:unnamed protein product [Sphenostylis stenocarpa]
MKLKQVGGVSSISVCAHNGPKSNYENGIERKNLWGISYRHIEGKLCTIHMGTHSLLTRHSQALSPVISHLIEKAIWSRDRSLFNVWHIAAILLLLQAIRTGE